MPRSRPLPVPVLLALAITASAAPASHAGTWHKVFPTWSNSTVNGCAYSTLLDRYVAVGALGLIQTSSDGTTWEAIDRDTDVNTLNAVAEGNGIVLAVGLGRAIRSTDGVSWDSVTPGGTGAAALLDVLHDGTRFVAVRAAGRIYYSTDGISWSYIDISIGNPTGIAFDGTTYVLTQLGGNPATSTDLTNWTPAATGAALNDVTFGDGQFVAVGSNGAVYTSANGATWTDRTIGGGPDLHRVHHTGTHFVATGANGAVYTSTDATSWGLATDQAEEQSTKTLWAACGSGKVLAAGDDGFMLSSEDLDAWTPETPDIDNLNDIVWGEDRYVAVGANGYVLTNTGGANWTPRDSGSSVHLRRVAWSQTSGLFVAVGDDATVLTSPDGSAWTARTVPISDDLAGVAVSGTRLVATGALGAVLTSDDGINWTDRRISGEVGTLTVRHDGVRFLATSRYGQSHVSTDGVSWTASDTADMGNSNDIGFGNGVYANGHVFSTDALIWDDAAVPTAGVNALLFDGDLLVAAGASGSIRTSPDGSTWTALLPLVTTNNLNGAAATGPSHVIVGDGGTILFQSGFDLARTAGPLREGRTTSLSLRPASRPSANVTITFAADAGLELDAASLTFTPGNWLSYQWLEISAPADNTKGQRDIAISYTVTSDDANYDGMTVADTVVAVIDAPEKDDDGGNGGGSGGSAPVGGGGGGGGGLGMLSLLLLALLGRRRA